MSRQAPITLARSSRKRRALHMATVVVEKVWEQPVSREKLGYIGQKMVSCLQLRDAHWVRSLIVDGGTRTICTFEAPDAESVRQSYRELGASYTNIWAAETLAAEPER
jgi:hypothetical protein